MAKQIVRAGAHPSNKKVEGRIAEVILDEQIVDPNSPLAVQTPQDGVGGVENPLDALNVESPNESADGDNAPVYVNPLTDEIVTGPDADPQILSPTSDAVSTPDSVADVQPTAEGDVTETHPEPTPAGETPDPQPAPAEEPVEEPAPAEEAPAEEPVDTPPTEPVPAEEAPAEAPAEEPPAEG